MENGNAIKKWIKYNTIINKNIYETLSYMDYNIDCEYQGINKKNYSKKVVKFIQNNKDDIMRVLKLQPQHDKFVTELIKSADKNGDGYIDYKEFVDMMEYNPQK